MKPKIVRFKNNPILLPDANSEYMRCNVFNPGAIKINNLVYILFRCTNCRKQVYSSNGLAVSHDGINFTIVSGNPVLRYQDYGSWTTRGVEDPRIVEWNDYFYVFATACSKDHDRVGIWKTDDFINFNLVNIPYDCNCKDATIIPQRYGNKIYLLYRVYPDIWIGETFSTDLTGKFTKGRKLLDSRDVYGEADKIGTSGPPVKLNNGDWLVTYHAVYHDSIHGRQYELSFLILDGDDPKIIKYLHDEPILVPEDPWEISWYGGKNKICSDVENVVFSNAIIDFDEKYFYVYWGAADTVICAGALRKSDVLKFI